VLPDAAAWLKDWQGWEPDNVALPPLLASFCDCGGYP
jgi:hypothetical protein